MALNVIRDWAPFHIDALGLVTILRAAEVGLNVGRLVYNCLTEWLPLFGAYTVASRQISRPIPGFVLYNINDGVMATDVSCWLTRWLLSLPLTYTASVESTPCCTTATSTAKNRSKLYWPWSFSCPRYSRSCHGRLVGSSQCFGHGNVRGMRAIGWTSFGVHNIALGMACLFSQIVSVCVLASSSVLAVLQIGDSQAWLVPN